MPAAVVRRAVAAETPVVVILDAEPDEMVGTSAWTVWSPAAREGTEVVSSMGRNLLPVDAGTSPEEGA